MALKEDHGAAAYNWNAGHGVVGICRHAASLFRRGYIPLLLTVDAISFFSYVVIQRFDLQLHHEKAKQELDNIFTADGEGEHHASPSTLGGWNNIWAYLLFKFVIVWGALVAQLAINSFRVGTVAYSMVAVHMGKRPSIKNSLACGLKSGIARLMWLNFLQGAVSMFVGGSLLGMGLYYDGVDMENMEHISTTLDLVGIVSSVFLHDGSKSMRVPLLIGLGYACCELLEQLYVVACWVMVLEGEHWVFRAISRSWSLLKCLGIQAFILWLLQRTAQAFILWLLQRAVPLQFLEHIIGHFYASVLMPPVRMYFTLVWLAFYLSVFTICNGPSIFSDQTLEHFLDKFKEA